jgi:hypothetical protein
MGTGFRDADAVVGAVDVFVSDYYHFFGLGEDGLHRLKGGGLEVISTYAGLASAEISLSIHDGINHG